MITHRANSGASVAEGSLRELSGRDLPGIPAITSPASSSLPLVSRGVYVHPFTGLHGERIIVGVDRLGRKRIEMTTFGSDDHDAVLEMVWDALDRMDPPGLQLIS